MPQVVFLNGPPQSGKDTAANFIAAEMPRAVKLKFSDPVKAGTHAAYGLPAHTPIDAFETVKDQPLDEFLGFTPREAYIAHSEKYMKVQHGNDVYGRIAVNRLPPSGLAVFADCGFESETWPIIRAVGAENVMVIHLQRRGCSFKNDSRDYIFPYNPSHISVHPVLNNQEPEWFYEQIDQLLAKFVPDTDTDTTTINTTL